MRSYQPVGLIAGAKNWVEENCVKEPDLVCPDCHCVISTRLKVLEVTLRRLLRRRGSQS
jgi:hypothetical protein